MKNRFRYIKFKLIRNKCFHVFKRAKIGNYTDYIKQKKEKSYFSLFNY